MRRKLAPLEQFAALLGVVACGGIGRWLVNGDSLAAVVALSAGGVGVLMMGIAARRK